MTQSTGVLISTVMSVLALRLSLIWFVPQVTQWLVGTLFPCGTRVKVHGIGKVPDAAFSMTVLRAQVVAKVPALALQVASNDDVIFHRRSTRSDGLCVKVSVCKSVCV